MRKGVYDYFSNADRLFLKLVVFLTIILLVSQAFMLKGTLRNHISQVDKLEGERISLESPTYVEAPLQISDSSASAAGFMHSLRENRSLVVRMVKPANAPEVYILVNGKVIDDFHKGQVRLTVYDGDFVEIDATSLPEPAQFVINTIGGKTNSPINGLMLESKGNIVPIGKIKFK